MISYDIKENALKKILKMFPVDIQRKIQRYRIKKSFSLHLN